MESMAGGKAQVSGPRPSAGAAASEEFPVPRGQACWEPRRPGEGLGAGHLSGSHVPTGNADLSH